ncbi:hypothetical protein DdX_03206 [Ditylenchus destructor]|uniref:MARVEL domain-containing protein n=1 Tax=Ditylenchus destructor TaxID=166010 RepID=A0AAD4NJD5_9BILA|nr:hypothetical protein DdX_03206 [Ditylenchus destructor]
MAVVARSTVTTTRTSSSGGRFAKVIPLWTIKLVTAILGAVILVLILLQPRDMWSYYSRTFIIITLTCGFLLGWSVPSVLRQFLPFYRVDMLLHTIIATLAIVSLIVCAIYLIDNEKYSRSEQYRLMVGIGVCLAVESVIFAVLAIWICFGNYTIVDTA